MPEQTPPNERNTDDAFFVGYLPVPRVLASFLKVLTLCLLILVLGASVVLSLPQSDPGPGVWHDGDPRSFEGVLMMEPYPMLVQRIDAADSGFETLLLVSEGKHGALDRTSAFAGQFVRLRGDILQRDQRRLLELDPADDAVTAAAGSVAPPTVEPAGRVTLRGEIIDPKCYFGAMKPGTGKTHKACATLCIKGGIPPMFVTRDASGHETFFLLANPAGAALDDSILPFVADPVEITGELERRGDLLLLKIRSEEIRRL